MTVHQRLASWSYGHGFLRRAAVGAAARLLMVTTLAGALVASPRTDQPELQGVRIGDRAPGLSKVDWIRGEAVSRFKKGQVYLVYFYSTPGGVGFFQMKDLAAKFAGEVVSVGIWAMPASCIGSSVSRAGHEELIRRWTKAENVSVNGELSVHPDAILRIGASDGQKLVNRYFGRVVNCGGDSYRADCCQVRPFPGVFVVDRNARVAWAGSPFSVDEIERALESVLHRTWDMSEAKRAVESKWRKVIDSKRRSCDVMDDVERMWMRGQWDEYLQFAGQAITLTRCEMWRVLGYENLRVAGYEDEARRAALDYWQAARSEDGHYMGVMTFAILSAHDRTPAAGSSDLDIAQAAVQYRVDATRRSHPNFLRDLALIHAMKGEWSQAVEVQQEALSKARRFFVDGRYIFTTNARVYRRHAGAVANEDEFGLALMEANLAAYKEGAASAP